MKIPYLPEEVWFGGAVTDGVAQPYTAAFRGTLDLTVNRTPNQMTPVLLSTAGRWLYHPKGMAVSFAGDGIHCSEGTQLHHGGSCLKDAYLDAVKTAFPFERGMPDERLFRGPVYNTWIELTFGQRQERILAYAQDLLNAGMPAGVLMIDDGWSDYYGKWEFSPGKFPNPGQMISRLKEMGFAVMVWVVPFITADTVEYRDLRDRGLLVCDSTGQVHIARWWNGCSAVLDMTKPEACAWLREKLDALMALGVEGFKFDAGDPAFYPADIDVTPSEHSQSWTDFGSAYKLNEFRSSESASGLALMQRQCDKDHSWNERGLEALIPDAIVQSMTGYPFLCPDMIGGGEYLSFRDLQVFDEELVVRWAQIAALMPVMQFSAAPWRVLSPENFARVMDAVAMRKRYQSHIDRALDECVRGGGPVLRPMTYEFPEDLACRDIMDQFMLGSEVLVAPITKKGCTSRQVYLPVGVWREVSTGVVVSGGQMVQTRSDLPVYERVM